MARKRTSAIQQALIRQFRRLSPTNLQVSLPTYMYLLSKCLALARIQVNEKTHFQIQRPHQATISESNYVHTGMVIQKYVVIRNPK